MGNYGIKISKVGSDVKTATDKNLILTSKYPIFKIHTIGTTTVTVPANSTVTQSTNVAHGLGFTPAAQVFVIVNEAGDIFKTNAQYGSGYANGYPAIGWFVDSNNITCYVKHGIAYGSDIVYTFNYIIFYERIL